MNIDGLQNYLNRTLAPFRDAIMLLTGKAVITLVDDTKDIQEVQLSALAGETLSRVPRVQNFGFASNPPKDSEAIIVSLGAQRENVVVVTADNRKVRFKNLAPGECAVYTDDGTVIHLKKGGLVDVIAATKILVQCPEVEFTGNVKIGGNLTVQGNEVVVGNETVMGNAIVSGQGTFGMSVAVAQVVGAAGYTGPAGAPMAMTVPLTTTGTVTAANVVGGGTDLASIKAKYNAHTHPETGTVTGSTGTTL